MNEIVLKYVGTGSFIEVPARDLTQEDLDRFAWTGWTAEQLVESKQYEYVKKPKQDNDLVKELVTKRKVKDG